MDEPIVLINDTPDVEINEAAGTASVRVDFTLRSDVVSAECSLGANFPPADCEDHNNYILHNLSLFRNKFSMMKGRERDGGEGDGDHTGQRKTNGK